MSLTQGEPKWISFIVLGMWVVVFLILILLLVGVILYILGY